jgi:hypothetical protein
MKIRLFPLISASAAIALAFFGGSSGLLASTVIYQDLFTGGSGTLNGAAPDTRLGVAGGSASATWNSSGWTQNGVKSSPAAGNAWLPFNPESGNVYTLTLAVDLTNASSSWAAIGFATTASPSTTGEFWGALGAEDPWMLIRGQTSGSLPTLSAGAYRTFSGNDPSSPPNPGSDEEFLGAGPGFGGRATSADPSTESPTRFYDIIEMVLDTNPAFWTTSWFATNGQTGIRQQLGSTVAFAVPNPGITHVGFGGNSGSIGDVNNFTLSYVPEPTSALAGALLGLGILRRRR